MSTPVTRLKSLNDSSRQSRDFTKCIITVVTIILLFTINTGALVTLRSTAGRDLQYKVHVM